MFRRRAPHLDVELLELTTLKQIAALKDGRIDAGLGRIQIEDSEISVQLLYNEPLVLAVPAITVLRRTRGPSN